MEPPRAQQRCRQQRQQLRLCSALPTGTGGGSIISYSVVFFPLKHQISPLSLSPLLLGIVTSRSVHLEEYDVVKKGTDVTAPQDATIGILHGFREGLFRGSGRQGSAQSAALLHRPHHAERRPGEVRGAEGARGGGAGAGGGGRPSPAGGCRGEVSSSGAGRAGGGSSPCAGGPGGAGAGGPGPAAAAPSG